MWNLREIPLEVEPDVIEGVLITGIGLEEQEQALTVLARAERDADTIRANAQHEADTIMATAKEDALTRMNKLLEEVEGEFLSQAEKLFFEWNQDRETEADATIARAKKLVEKVLNGILDQLPDEDKIQAVLRQVAKASDPRNAAELHYHTQQQEIVTAWKHNHPSLPWTLHPSDDQDADQVLLRTDQGELSLSWTGFHTYIIQRLL